MYMYSNYCSSIVITIIMNGLYVNSRKCISISFHHKFIIMFPNNNNNNNNNNNDKNNI